MLNVEEEQKFKDLRIKVRQIKKTIPYYGTINGEITKFNYKVRHFQDQVILP